jgi:hypothetical protein
MLLLALLKCCGAGSTPLDGACADLIRSWPLGRKSLMKMGRLLGIPDAKFPMGGRPYDSGKKCAFFLYWSSDPRRFNICTLLQHAHCLDVSASHEML